MNNADELIILPKKTVKTPEEIEAIVTNYYASYPVANQEQLLSSMSHLMASAALCGWKREDLTRLSSYLATLNVESTHEMKTNS